MSKKLYKRFSADHDFSGVDHIIIGSGIGGLTAATWLAKAGKKVVVFERHYVPGGLTHCFKRKYGFKWDVGVHYVGNVGKKGALRQLFDFLTDHTLDWESMGDVYDVAYINGEKYEFRAGIENFRKQLKGYFPEESKAIDKYLKLIVRSNKRGNAFFFEKSFKPFLSKSIGALIRWRFNKYSDITTWDMLSTVSSNKRLLAVLCAQCGNYGLTPKQSSFAAHALVVGHFMEGGYYPKGGSEQIANKTIETINSLGGQVFIKAEVQEIVTENSKVQGVRIDDKFIACKSVISNVGVNNTFNYLLSENDRKRCNFQLKNIQPSTGHLCLYVGLNKTDIELELPKHNIWWFSNDDFDDSFDGMNLKNVSDEFAYISFPSAKDPEWQKKNPGTSTIQAISAGHFEWFSSYAEQPWMKRGENYLELKAQFEKSMLNKLFELLPQIKEHVLVTEVSTPLSTKHFTNYQNGEIYGLEHSPARFTLPFLRPETKIKGLRLVGQDITIVGVAGAMLSGMLGAITILKFKAWGRFREMQKGKS